MSATTSATTNGIDITFLPNSSAAKIGKSKGKCKTRIHFRGVKDEAAKNMFAIAAKHRTYDKAPKLGFFDRRFVVLKVNVYGNERDVKEGYVKVNASSLRQRLGINKQVFNKKKKEERGDMTTLIQTKLQELTRETVPASKIQLGEDLGKTLDRKGIFKYASGSVYEGQLKNGKREGKGKLKYADGSVYEGEFKNDKREGQGKLKFSSRSVYEGEFKNGKYDGQGKYTFADGSVYEGEFKNDKYKGKGILKYASGAVYDGEFKNGKREGQGKYTFADGSVYEGEFKNDKYDGQGKYTFASGSMYEGEFKNDKREGQGKYTFANGNELVGQFKNNMKI